MHAKDVLGEVTFNKKIVWSYKTESENPHVGKLPGGPRDIITYLFLKVKGDGK